MIRYISTPQTSPWCLILYWRKNRNKPNLQNSIAPTESSDSLADEFAFLLALRILTKRTLFPSFIPSFFMRSQFAYPVIRCHRPYIRLYNASTEPGTNRTVPNEKYYGLLSRDGIVSQQEQGLAGSMWGIDLEGRRRLCCTLPFFWRLRERRSWKTDASMCAVCICACLLGKFRF